jgi:hypothetical protein
VQGLPAEHATLTQDGRHSSQRGSPAITGARPCFAASARTCCRLGFISSRSWPTAASSRSLSACCPSARPASMPSAESCEEAASARSACTCRGGTAR